MGKINLGRVLLGGLVAGVVINFGEFLLNGVVLAKDMADDLARLHLTDPGTAFIIRAVAISFVLGAIIVYLYAAIRPRFGAGVRTAIVAGVIAWSFVFFYCGYIYYAMGITTQKTYLIALVWGIVEYTLGAIAGAAIYKES